MKRTYMEELFLYKTLSHKMGSTHDVLDFLERGGALSKNTADIDAMTKNVCAKISSELAENLDQMCNFLDISKRKFIETAIIEALNKANEIIKEVDPFPQEESGQTDEKGGE